LMIFMLAMIFILSRFVNVIFKKLNAPSSIEVSSINKRSFSNNKIKILN
jgi:hypothetical protein